MLGYLLLLPAISKMVPIAKGFSVSDNCSISICVFIADTTEDDKKPEGPPEKSKRTWEKWSPSDKAVFFEALNDFGKNFQALQNHIAKKKMKNKAGQDQVRNRDQIRFFYYRTLNKISKYVQFPPGA